MYGKLTVFLLVGIALALLVLTFRQESREKNAAFTANHIHDQIVRTPEASSAIFAPASEPSASLDAVNAVKKVGPVTLRGQALDQDGYPIAHLPLVLATSSEAARDHLRVLTDRQGQFLLTGLDRRRYTLQSTDPAYGLGEPTEFSLEDDASLQELDIHFHSLIELRGVLLDPYGRPVSDASVYTQGMAGPGLFASEAVVSDTAGEFRLRVPFERRAAEEMASLAINETDMAVNTDICLVIEHEDYQLSSHVLSLSPGKIDVGQVWLKTKASIVDVSGRTSLCSSP